MAVSAAVMLQVGKVEVHAMPDAPPPYLQFYKPKRPMFIREMVDVDPIAPLEIDRIRVFGHRLIGLSVRWGYWSDSWQDEWAIEELLKWEGRGDEIRRDQFYADFIIDENQQARENERRQIERGHSGQRPRTFVVHESVREPRMGTGTPVLGRAESDAYLRLERGVSGGHDADLQGEDGEQ